MHDNEILKRLAEAAREEEEDDRARLGPRWNALSAGTLSAAEEEALRAEARVSPIGNQALDAFSPLGSKFRAEVLDKVRPQLAADAMARGRPPDRRAHGPLTSPWFRWSAAAAGLAAATFLLVMWPDGNLGPLPAYTLTLAGQDREMRADPDEPPVEAAAPWAEPQLFSPSNRFELELTPRTGVDDIPALMIFRRQGAELTRWTSLGELAEWSAKGTVRIVGTVGEDIGLAPGTTTGLLIAVGRPGALPPADELLERLIRENPIRENAWLAWRLEIAVSAPP